MNKRSFPELLAPAGDLERLRVCLLYGADAVYLGGRSGNLRAACAGLSAADIERGAAEARAAGARLYYCLNSFSRELLAQHIGNRQGREDVAAGTTGHNEERLAIGHGRRPRII